MRVWVWESCVECVMSGGCSVEVVCVVVMLCDELRDGMVGWWCSGVAVTVWWVQWYDVCG